MAMSKSTTHATIDHDEIRSWAEERGARPSVVRNVRGPGPGILRLDLPGYSEGRLEEIEWDDWFEKFDDSNLAFVYQEQTARGEMSNFNKLVARDSVDLATGRVRTKSARARSSGKASSGTARAPVRGRRGAKAPSSRAGSKSARGARAGSRTKASGASVRRKVGAKRGGPKPSRARAQRSGARSR